MKRFLVGGGVAAGALVLASLVLVSAPIDESDDRPFVRHGEAGETVRTRYADFRVEGVHAADRIESSKVEVAAGTFLMVDVLMRGHHEAVHVSGVNLRDARGRVHIAVGGIGGPKCTSDSAELPVELPWHARFCFDVPADALAGSTLILGRGSWTTDHSETRMDEVAEIELGISVRRARELWAAEETWRGFTDGPYPLDDDALEPVAGSDDEPEPVLGGAS